MIHKLSVIAALLVAGCSPPMLRGEFALLSTEDISGKYMVLSDQPLTGRACFNIVKSTVFIGEGVFDRAVRNALVGQSEDTLLVDVEFEDDGSCIEVKGLPARLN